MRSASLQKLSPLSSWCIIVTSSKVHRGEDRAAARIGCGSLRVATHWCERTSMISPSRLTFLDWRLYPRDLHSDGEHGAVEPDVVAVGPDRQPLVRTASGGRTLHLSRPRTFRVAWPVPEQVVHSGDSLHESATGAPGAPHAVSIATALASGPSPAPKAITWQSQMPA